MPSQLRHLFAFLLVYCQPVNVKELWEKYLDDLIEDFIFEKDTKDLAIAKTLVFIEKYLIQNGLNLSNFPELPVLNPSLLDEDQENSLIADEQNYDQEEID